MHNEQKVTDHIYWIGGNDFVSTRFENLIPISRGISYNSYFIDDEKTAVLDTVDSVIRDVFMDNVSHLLHGRQLDYIVINHMEPDHSGSLLALARAYPEAKIIATPQAQKMIGQYFHVSLKDRFLSSDEKLEISLGTHRLRFLKAPMVHWPEVTFTYEETEKVLFSADAFGTFGVLNGSVFADDVDYEEEYLPSFRKYYANIVARYGMQVQMALKKVEKLDVKYLCSLHGPVFRRKEDIAGITALYRKWASWEPEEQSVSIFFSSPYGNTAMAAQILAGKLAAKGVKNLKLVDLCSSSITEAFPEVLRRSHMVLAAVTMNMGLNPVMNAFLGLCHEMDVQNRTIAIVGNSSWAPNVSGKMMLEKVKTWKKCTVLGEPVHISSAPADDDTLEKLAGLIADDIMKEKKA
jgi:flavorubredoxin|nr:MBL fold metallo-hydrolase [uncultured Dialister sp.]